MKTKIMMIAAATALLYLNVNAGNGLHLPGSGKPLKNVPAAALPKKLEYDNNKQTIRAAYYANLDQLAKTIVAEDYAVAIRGHADSVGRYKYNWVLSEDRAVNVKKYLVNKGVKEDRIVATPFGSTVPVASNKTAAGRQKNRRVEIQLKEIR